MTDRAAQLAFSVLCPFGGSGGGALGFLDAEVRLLGAIGRFECLGSIDLDREACEDFGRFTGSDAWCADVREITPAELRSRFGERAPDVVFLSPPCQGASRLLSATKARTKKYEELNRLSLVWTTKMLEAWPDPPPLVLLENVPGLPTRASGMLRDVQRLLRAAGYVCNTGTHDCGEIGGLAQHRKRFLLVARLPSKCPPILYQPPRRRVRACGEVLEQLPMPATEAARPWGALHEMPALTWRNWLRLALIPAGGDWRDLEGVLAEGQERREVFRRHAVADWEKPIEAVTGPGGHTVGAVSDPRLALRCAPREGNWGTYGVLRWTEPCGTIAGRSDSSNGRYSVADLRVSRAYDAGYGVLRWADPARTIAGTSAVGCGAYAVADERAQLIEGARVLTLDEALALDLPPSKRPPFTPVIVSRDGSWHRPLTLLELAALQSYPAHVLGEPIRFSGTRTQVATHIGNSVPPHAGRAIAEQMLVALMQARLEAFALSSGDVWVAPEMEARC